MSVSAVVVLVAASIVVAFCGGFGSCLMLVRRIDQDGLE